MSAGTDGLPPRAVVSQMATGYWTSQAVRAMAVLGLADHLATGSRTAEEYRQLLVASGFDEVAVLPAEGTP